jgi:hypothetical protein
MSTTRTLSRSLLSVVGAALLALSLGSTPSFAADLDYRTPPSDRYGTAYSDPRYADIYGYQKPVPPQHYGYQHPGYAPPPPPHVPIPHEPVYKYPPRYSEDYAPPRGYAPPGYGPPPRSYSHRNPNCLSKDTIQRELIADGWREFHAPNVLNQDEATLRARRPDGRLFELRVDRCTGEVIAARPLGEPGYGPQVYGYRGYPRAY